MCANPCAVCSEEDPAKFRIYFDGYIKLYKCLECGFVAQYPGPGSNTIITSNEDLDFDRDNQENMYPERLNGIKDIARRITAYKQSGTLLDVGCGDGFFLKQCVKMGFDCYGVEDSKALSSYAATRSEAHIVQGIYTKDLFSPGKFDIITFIQVLEHIPSLLQVLDAVKYHLKPEGIVVIEVPSIKAPHFIAYEATGIKWFVRPHNGVAVWHCNYFSPSSLNCLMNRAHITQLSLVTGRWQYKYTGLLSKLGKLCDPLFNSFGIGGI